MIKPQYVERYGRHTPEQAQKYADWMLTRPIVVRYLARLYPPGGFYYKDGQQWFLLGWTDRSAKNVDEARTDPKHRAHLMLIVSITDPAEDYHLARKSRRYVCCHHIRPIAKEDRCKAHAQSARTNLLSPKTKSGG